MNIVVWCTSVSLLVLASACSAHDPGEVVATETQSLEVVHRLGVARTRTRVVGVVSALDSQNGLAPGLFSREEILESLRELAATPLGSRHAKTIMRRIAALEDGGSLLQYLAKCALKREKTLPDSAVQGRLGLAPEWLTRPLSEEGQGWVTACLLAHANDRAHVDIALSGEHPALAGSGPPPAVEAHFEEAAFYGNVFQEAKQDPVILFACSGAHAAGRCDDRGLAQDFWLRVCGSSSSCGFQHTGACLAPTTTDTLEACLPDLPYKACRRTPRPRGSAGDGVMRQVITAYLPTDVEANLLHPTACPQQPVKP